MQIYCCGIFQELEEFTDPRNKQVYYIGKCLKCKKNHVIHNNKHLEAQTAKRIVKNLEGKLRRKKKSEKYISQTNFNFRHYETRKKVKRFKNKKITYQYQVECYHDGTTAKDPEYKRLKVTELQFINESIKSA